MYTLMYMWCCLCHSIIPGVTLLSTWTDISHYGVVYVSVYFKHSEEQSLPFCPLGEASGTLWALSLSLTLSARGVGSDGNCAGFPSFWRGLGMGNLWFKSQVIPQFCHHPNECLFRKTQREAITHFWLHAQILDQNCLGFLPSSLLSSYSFSSPEWFCKNHQLLCPFLAPTSWHLFLNQLFPLAAADFYLVLCFPPCNVLHLLWMFSLQANDQSLLSCLFPCSHFI